MFTVTFDGGPADMRRYLRDDLPEELVEDGGTYRLGRNDQGGPLIFDTWAGYRYRWVRPELPPNPDAAPAHGTGGIPDHRRGTPGAYAWEQ